MRLDAFFVDIDGTILRSDHSLSECVLSAIHRLNDEGVIVCLATGRSWEALKGLYDTLKLTGPTICYNGAMIVEGTEGAVVFEKRMDEQAARIVLNEARGRGIEFLAYRSSALVYERVGREIEAYCKRIPLSGEIVDFDRFESLNFTKSICIADPEILRPLKEFLDDSFSEDTLSVTYSNPKFLEAMGGNIDKGRALRELCRIRGINPAHTVAMGDGWNDLALMEAAGDAWVMGNAPENLKNRFPPERHAPPAEADGVAQVIEAMLENRYPILNTLRKHSPEVSM